MRIAQHPRRQIGPGEGGRAGYRFHLRYPLHLDHARIAAYADFGQCFALFQAQNHRAAVAAHEYVWVYRLDLEREGLGLTQRHVLFTDFTEVAQIHTELRSQKHHIFRHNLLPVICRQCGEFKLDPLG